MQRINLGIEENICISKEKEISDGALIMPLRMGMLQSSSIDRNKLLAYKIVLRFP